MNKTKNTNIPPKLNTACKSQHTQKSAISQFVKSLSNKVGVKLNKFHINDMVRKLEAAQKGEELKPAASEEFARDFADLDIGGAVIDLHSGRLACPSPVLEEDDSQAAFK